MNTRDEIAVASSSRVAAELAAALVVAAVFAGLCWIGSGYRGAAAFMPVAVSALGTASALTWAVGLLRRLGEDAGETTLSRASLRRLGTLTVLMIAFIAAIPYAGFFTAILVFMAVAPVLMGLRPAWQAILSGVGLSVLLWLIFKVLLESPMPTDLIFGG